MKRRAARLVPLHWLTLFAFAAIGVSLVFGVQVKEPGKYDWQCFLPSLSMLHSLGVCRHLAFNYASWSISAEMLLYLLFPLFCVVARRGAWIRVTAAVAVVVWLTASDLDSYSTEKFWVTYTQSGGFVRAIPSFLMGMCLYAWRAKLSRLPRPELAMYASLIMFLALGFAGTPPFILLPVIYLLAATAVSADMQGKISALPARLSVGGQLTYSVYMLHPLAGTALIAFVGERLLHLGPGALLVWSLMVAVLVGVSAYLSFTFFETPMRRWISGWNFSGSRRAASRQI
jgi:peptidoglycan/LPS O-acetylase OafA/YrhL